jgi:hypothetical protein
MPSSITSVAAEAAPRGKRRAAAVDALREADATLAGACEAGGRFMAANLATQVQASIIKVASVVRPHDERCPRAQESMLLAQAARPPGIDHGPVSIARR